MSLLGLEWTADMPSGRLYGEAACPSYEVQLTVQIMIYEHQVPLQLAVLSINTTAQHVLLQSTRDSTTSLLSFYSLWATISPSTLLRLAL